MTDKISARLIEAAVATLREDVLADIDDPVSRIKIDHITRMLWTASARIELRENALNDLVSCLTRDNGCKSSAEDARRDAEFTFAQRLPDLLSQVATSDSAMSELRTFVNAKKEFYVKLDPDILDGTQVVYQGGRISSERKKPNAIEEYTPINDETLTDYVRKKFDDNSIFVDGVRHIPGGFSKVTVLFTLRNSVEGSAEELVIRKDQSVPLMKSTVLDEYPLLKRLSAIGFRVADPVWVEENREIFGGAFIVSKRAAGTSDAAAWSADPKRASAACNELAVLLAELHNLSPVELGYSQARAAESSGQSLEQEINKWTDVFYSIRHEPFPMQEMPLIWLKQNIPAELYDRPARLVHGDIGFHNLMFDDEGTATALLDWEFAALGDPMQDLRFVRQFVHPLGYWDTFLESYHSAGGSALCKNVDFFFDLFTQVRNAAGCVHCQELFENAMPNESRFALAGHVFGPYLFVEQCEALLSYLEPKK